MRVKNKTKSWNLLNRVFSKKQQILFWIAVVFVLAFSINLIINYMTKETQTIMIAAPVRLIQPEYGTLTKRLQLGGHIESERMVTVLPLSSGVIDNISVQTGDQVKKGQSIAKINSDAYELQLSQAKSAFLLAKSTFERLEKLQMANAVSRQEFDSAKTQYDAYASQYELAKLQVNYTNVQAPLDGVILVKHLNAGDLAAPERPLVTIGDINSLIVKVNIPEDYYDLFLNNQDKMKVKLYRKRNNLESAEGYDLYIDHIAPFISAQSRNFQVVCALKKKESSLRPGMSIYLDFILEEKKDIYFLPFDVLVGTNKAWILNEESVQQYFSTHESNGDISFRERFIEMRNKSEGSFLFGNEKIAVNEVEIISTFQTDRHFEIDKGFADNLFLIEGQHFVVENQYVKVLK